MAVLCGDCTAETDRDRDCGADRHRWRTCAAVQDKVILVCDDCLTSLRTDAFLDTDT